MRLGGVTRVERVPPSQIALLSLLALAIVASGWDALYPQNTWLQLGPCVLVLLGAVPLLRRHPLTTGSIACMIGFLLLHCLAARWSYSFVPYDVWSRLWIDGGIDAHFGFTRNMFDRLVHFAFGLLAIRPVVEIGQRYFGLSRRAAIYIAIEFVLASSAAYEVFEWLLAVTMDPAAADAYNGQQGDIFDSAKDMALAGLGAVVAYLSRRMILADVIRRS